MQNIFEQIQLTHVDSNTIESSQNKKDQQVGKIRQRQSSYRQGIDYQQIKKRNDCLKEIEQLKNNIKQTLQKNLEIYQKITQTSSDFSGVLFYPKSYYQTLKINNYQDAKIYEHKLLHELDKLYEQNCLLEKQLNKAKFISQHEQKQKEDTLCTKINHYQFLRNVWQNKNQYSSKSNESGINSEDILQNLNKKVAMVRLGINRILKEQKQHQSSHQPQIDDYFVQKSVKYQKLLKLYELAQMKIEEQNSFIEQRILSLPKESKIQNQSDQIQKLTLKIKELQTLIRKKDDLILTQEKQLSQIAKKETNLKFVFHTNTQKQSQFSHFYEVKVYTKRESSLKLNESIKQVQHYQTNSDLSQFLQKLKSQSEKMIGFQSQSQLSRFNSQKRIFSERKPVYEFTFDQIQKDRMNLLRKTNILTENLSQYNTARRNFSKQKMIEKTPEIEEQKQNIIVRKFESISKGDKLDVDFPEFPISLASAQTKTKFVRSSNRQR